MPSLPLLKYWLTDRVCLYPSQNMNMKGSKVFPAEKKRRGGCKALITIVACLYALLALSLGQVALAVYLFASKPVEPTTFLGENITTVAVSSGLTTRTSHVYYSDVSSRGHCRQWRSSCIQLFQDDVAEQTRIKENEVPCLPPASCFHVS